MNQVASLLVSGWPRNIEAIVLQDANDIFHAVVVKGTACKPVIIRLKCTTLHVTHFVTDLYHEVERIERYDDYNGLLICKSRVALR